jgi:ribosomal protein S18 acetylase RimI-like enzyme
MQIHRFNSQLDYQIYRSWFVDEELNRQLGPLDQEWLDCIMAESGHRQFAIWEGGEMISVVGVESANAVHPYWYVTDMAVKPSLRGQGIGSRVLSAICTAPDHQDYGIWRAGVMKSNPRAARFLERNGWHAIEPAAFPSQESLMWIYELRL